MMRLEVFGIPMCIAAFATLWSIAAMPSTPNACERNVYSAKSKRVIDGDTFEAVIDLGFGVELRRHIRVHGVDTPEIHGPKADRDMVRGTAARKFTENWLERHGWQIELVVRDASEKYGRVDADVYPVGGGESLSAALRAAGYDEEGER